MQTFTKLFSRNFFPAYQQNFTRPKTFGYFKHGLLNYMPRSFFGYRKPTTPWIRQSNQFLTRKKNETVWEGGVWLFTFGLCYLAVPFYTILCQHLGFDTDLKQKDYSVVQGQGGKDLHIHRKFKLRFEGDVDPELNWSFTPINHEVHVNAGETALVFYKAHNHSGEPVVAFSTYQINPPYATLYFSKIQCFCFHQQLLNPDEELKLPIYFYLEPEILDDKYIADTKDQITVHYKFIKAKHQDLAKMARDELRRLQHNKRMLKEMRKQKRIKEGRTLDTSDLEDEEEDEDILGLGALADHYDQQVQENEQKKAEEAQS